MDNSFTRKEEICPLLGDFCNEEHMDCNICIYEEEMWQENQVIQDTNEYKCLICEYKNTCGVININMPDECCRLLMESLV